MERTLTSHDAPSTLRDLDLLVAEDARERTPSPFPEPWDQPPVETADAFDAQILAALVSP
jgi:hypothetical protein